ncbi:MAG: peptide chain release factor N(5)-glutamine methyltransferase [Armatimonadota bacterium]
MTLPHRSAGYTLSQLQAEGTQRLTAAGIAPAEARAETRLLLSFSSGLSREEIHLRPNIILPGSVSEKFFALLSRRERREPLAYILGEREFYGLSFQVTPAVLIPRPETEFLVEAALTAVKERSAPRVADIGTGSGIIAITLAVRTPQATVFATDISPEALSVAQENARRHRVDNRIVFAEGDLLAPLYAYGPFDAIVSNPPYIAPEAIDTLETEVRDFEPRVALGIHPDPLHFYRRLAVEAPPLLLAGGMLAVEVGQGQAEDVASLWRGDGLTNVSTVRDYAGIERVVLGYNSGYQCPEL